MRRSGIKVMARLVGLVRPLAGYMVLAIAMGLAGNLAATAITVLGAYGVLSVLGLCDVALAGVVVAMAVCAVLRGVLRYGEQASNHYIAFKLLALIRDRVFQALRRLAPAKLEGRGKGDLISVITSDIELLEVFYAHTVSPAAIALLFCCILVAFIGSLSPVLGAYAAASYLVVGVVLPWVTSRASGDRGLAFRTKSGELASFVLDSLRGLDEILQYGAGERRLAQMLGRTDALAEDDGDLKRSAGLSTAVTNGIILALDAGMLLLSVNLCATGAANFAGALIAVVALMGSFGPAVALANLGSTLQGTFAAGNRVLDILDERPVTDEVSGRAPTSFSGAAVRDVTFSYAGDEVLHGVSLDAPEGSIVGITGKSGSGKSTLLKLLMRFWDVDAGAVEISGRDVREVNTCDLREMESFVTQDTHLFHDSIRANLRIAKLDAADEEIESACRKASVHDFIMSLPQGYDTPVGELGDSLSGGERQRIGLARAFLHDAPFMLLDEPTSNLDSLNEAVILRSLVRERAGRTVLLVSHRSSTMRAADTVISVDAGRVS
ncbi:thiol reductant ABC exporter subunit CydC [Enorma phocaeensis]|uniref:Thiol reductant ABC exporter subunit CydC n=1 Tax=Enorma phocaeensis TaxID=1871019 RepID=A0A921IV51_9ACTN|nr:thiol reductant ABC exporter subunit CydC [Enorma phocaeensis]HJG37768.1 thiol reductant ABC exporter subunit CydC [Enorma phocaeensis]